MQTATDQEYEDTKYFTTKENLRQTIEQYGVAIIPRVFDEPECDSLLNDMWNYFEHITSTWETPLNRAKQETWREIYKLFPLHSMLIQYWGIGHAQFAWNARQNSKAVEIFAHLWNCAQENLLVSFDGASFHLPPEITGRGWNRSNTWYHTDQSFQQNEFECVQSFVSLLDIEEGDATLAFMESSNQYHAEFREMFNVEAKEDWYKLTKEEEEFYALKGCEYKKIKCPRGSMVFWDSRTIHCGVEPQRGRSNPKIRAVIYLCYLPRSRATAANLRKKQKAFAELRTTSHNPCKPTLFPKNPRTYGAELPQITAISPPILTALGRRLTGENVGEGV